MRVLKFGGAALRDGPAIVRAARIVREHGGERPVVVVSAHEGVTALLERAVEDARAGVLSSDPLRVRHRTILRQLGLPGDFLDRYLRELGGLLTMLCAERRSDRRLRDHVLSFGERMSARVFAAILRREGSDATPMDAFDLGLVSHAGHLERPELVGPRLAETLRQASGVAVVTGFLALDDAGHVATLGRNGSDLTAAWFAAALGAEEIQLWKDVPGLLSADPRLVPGARGVPALGWAEAEELARHGAQVLHPGALEPAARARIPVRLLDVHDPGAPGSRVAGESAGRGPLALAHRPKLARCLVELDASRERGPHLAELFGALAEHGIDPYLGRLGGSTLELLLAEEPRLAWALEQLGGIGRGVERAGELASLALVGPGVGADIELAGELGGLAAEHEGALEPADPQGRSRVVLVPRAGLAELAGRVHDAFFGRADRPSVAAAAALAVHG